MRLSFRMNTKAFEDLIRTARELCRTDRNKVFLSELSRRFKEHGSGMFLSLKQKAYLEQLATLGDAAKWDRK